MSPSDWTDPVLIVGEAISRETVKPFPEADTAAIAKAAISAYEQALERNGKVIVEKKDAQKARVLDQVRLVLWRMGEDDPENETAIKIGDLISDGLLGLPIEIEEEQ